MGAARERHYYTDVYGGVVAYKLVRRRSLAGGITDMLIPTMQAPLPEGLVCKSCSSHDLVRFGQRKTGQRYLCRACDVTFTDNGALPGKKIPPEMVGACISMFYGGLSIREVGRQMEQIYEIHPSNAAIYDWVISYSKAAYKTIADLRPTKLGKVWVADETVLKVSRRNHWFFDCVDDRTRFLLASHLSVGRTMRDAKTLMEMALQIAGSPPQTILTDSLRSYCDAIELVFGADTTHVQSSPFKHRDSTRAIERFHGTLKDRTKVMRGMFSHETAKLLLEGWLVHYNYLHGHEGLGGMTPARAAGIKTPFQNWTEIVKGKVG